MKLSWISCLTVFERQPLERNSASVTGRVIVEVLIASICVRVFLQYSYPRIIARSAMAGQGVDANHAM